MDSDNFLISMVLLLEGFDSLLIVVEGCRLVEVVCGGSIVF